MANPNAPISARSESLEKKSQQLLEAYHDGRLDLVAALADSIKDSVEFERQVQDDDRTLDLRPEDFLPVDKLPPAWAQWAEGWQHCKPLRLFETVGLGRNREPIELVVSFPGDQIDDPQREIRVAYVDSKSQTLVETPSQVTSDNWRGDLRICDLAFLATLPQHGSADFFIFYGNPLAERPNYTTDLSTDGESWRLRIENKHYVAQLSRQMGQLERITSKRQHGLELYAGGKGHGEPPTIDWAHDYVEAGGYQKLRMKNWAECRNYEVIRGPICTRIRRWGFPHSPLHPVISPSRMHIDVTYTFWSGLPTFFKESSMEAIADFRIEAMRDDEWVFSGYSFNKLLWMDAHGKLHQGPVPAEHQQNLWGVGFAHDESRDAFVALWLDHRVTGGGKISHGGVPTLQYDGHGQLWSRYPAERTLLRKGTKFLQRNAYLLFPWTDSAATFVEGERHRWTNPVSVTSNIAAMPKRAAAVGRLARPGETRASAGPKPAIWKALRSVLDDQLYGVDSNIVDLGYVFDVRFRAGVAHVEVAMPHAGRPVHEFLVTQGGGRVNDGIQETLTRIPGIDSVVVTRHDQMPWSIARLTPAGRKVVGL